jgi:hypothetical protein
MCCLFPFSSLLTEQTLPSTETQSNSSGAGALDMLSGAIRQAKHPTVAAFHIAFKALALFCYVFGSWFSSNDVFLFVIIILLLAADFWTVVTHV